MLFRSLDWRSDSPYMDTAKSVVNYKEGSGRGRLVQYGTSLRMSARHPLLGVGPGNWAVEYPRFAARDDPSLSSDGTTANPWPSSDWMTFVSERGVGSFILLALAMMALFVDGLRAVRDGRTPEERLSACTLLGTLSIGTRTVAIAAVGVIGAFALSRSASQLSAMSIFSTTSRLTRLEQASTLDPGSYRIHMRLAEGYARRGNCTRVIAHAVPARRLFPNAPQPRRLLAACGR